MAEELWPADPLTLLANRHLSDKGTRFNCAHGFTRVYRALLEPARRAPLRLLEIGLLHGQIQAEAPERIGELGCPSLRMWAEYLPVALIHGFDIVDFTAQADDRVRIWQVDQGDRAALRQAAAEAGGQFDLIIDDGSHASHHQQISLGTLFPFLAPGGWYAIEDLHYLPPGLEIEGITRTREFLRHFGHTPPGQRLALEQAEFAYLLEQAAALQFYDSVSPRWPLIHSADALALIRKRGEHPCLPAEF